MTVFTWRNLDPHLHRHNLVLNALEREGRRGKTVGALDAQLLYTYARPAGFVGQRLLRQKLTRSLGVRWTRALQQGGRTVDATVGTTEIQGLNDRQMLQAFSTRHVEVQEQLAAMGYSTAAAGALAAERTRQAKAEPQDEVAMEELERRWIATAAGFGLGPTTPSGITGQAPQIRQAAQADISRAFDQMQSETGLTQAASTYERDVVMALCETLPDDIEVTAAGLDHLARGFIAERAILVGIAGNEAALRTCDVLRVGEQSRLIGADELRYTTPEMLSTEIEGILEATSAPGAPIASRQSVDMAIAARPLLPEQRDMVVELTTNPMRVQTVVGEAGTGKTYALDAVREAFERDRTEVMGLALSAVRRSSCATRTSGVKTYAPSRRSRFGAERGGTIPAGAVVVVDEAGVVGTRDLVAIQRKVLTAGSRLVLVGDTEQLAEIDAGGYFRSLHRRLGEQIPGYRRGHELHTVIRQKDPRDVEALKALRLGDAVVAVKNLDERGLVFEGSDAREAARQMVADWLVARDAGKDVPMLARQRFTVHDLNALAQAVRAQRGEIAKESVEIAGGQRLHPGDAALFRRSNPELGLINGTRGNVRTVNPDDGSAWITVDGDREVAVDASWLNGVSRDGTEFVQLGYAGTGHVYQGATADVAFAFVSDDADRQWAYTVLSRHREEVRMYAVAEPSWVARSEDEGRAEAVQEPTERLAAVTAAMGRDSSKQTALDALQADPAARRRKAQEDRVAELIEKRRESGALGAAELTQLQRLQRALRQTEKGRRAARDLEMRREQQRRRASDRQREIGR